MGISIDIIDRQAAQETVLIAVQRESRTIATICHKSNGGEGVSVDVMPDPVGLMDVLLSGTTPAVAVEVSVNGSVLFPL